MRLHNAGFLWTRLSSAYATLAAGPVSTPPFTNDNAIQHPTTTLPPPYSTPLTSGIFTTSSSNCRQDRKSAPINMATVEHCLFCFEALSASLEKRTPMTLYQVQSSWTAYPKGLDEEDDEEQPELESSDSSPPSDNESGKPSSSVPVPRNPILERLFNSSSGSSTPASSSSSSLSPSTNNTTPSSSSTSFVPIGLHPRRTSQRSSNITESPLFITVGPLSFNPNSQSQNSTSQSPIQAS